MIRRLKLAIVESQPFPKPLTCCIVCFFHAMRYQIPTNTAHDSIPPVLTVSFIPVSSYTYDSHGQRHQVFFQERGYTPRSKTCYFLFEAVHCHCTKEKALCFSETRRMSYGRPSSRARNDGHHGCSPWLWGNVNCLDYVRTIVGDIETYRLWAFEPRNRESGGLRSEQFVM